MLFISNNNNNIVVYLFIIYLGIGIDYESARVIN